MNDPPVLKSRSDFDTELEWTAFCYVADELQDKERVAFEQRLGSDELAQQAVVSAVALSELIFAASHLDGVGGSAKTRLSPANSNWMANPVLPRWVCGAAVLLAVTAGAWLTIGHSDAPEGLLVMESPSVATAWADSFADVSMDESLVAEVELAMNFEDEVFDDSAAWMIDAFATTVVDEE